MDYLSLPESGHGYFNLVDASVLAALDAWWWEHGPSGDPDVDELIANKVAIQGSKPLQQQIQRALLRSIDLKELDAHICARELASSNPIPERTYAHMRDIQSCLEIYGLGNGHLIDSAGGVDDDDSYEIASKISRRRAAIRMGIGPEKEEIPNGDPLAVIEFLRKELKAKNLRIAHLEQQGHGRRSEGGAPLGPRQRNNLHRTIGALVTILLPHFKDKQEALIVEIESRFRGKEGLSKRTLETVLPLAKRALNEER